MKNLIDSYKKTKNLHHAYALEGDRKAALFCLYNFFENDIGLSTRGNPDFYLNEFENFGIEDGRILKSFASRKAVLEKRRIFVLAFTSITMEAQNALLKLFEEPAEGIHFFIVVSSSEIFLPTLRSRLHILKSAGTVGKVESMAGEFIKASKSERLNLLRDIIENKDKKGAFEFLNDLEAVLYKKSDLAKNIDIFNTIQKARNYMRDRSPSLKMILENVSLVVPAVK